MYQFRVLDIHKLPRKKIASIAPVRVELWETDMQVEASSWVVQQTIHFNGVLCLTVEVTFLSLCCLRECTVSNNTN